ncbi:M48 family metalloprotease [Streptomyces litchfieldiae]|uniref:M48 family metalloprotease n=1 Tax=Streptomyces litchfieldiae TaxID=3075543 RepID=A0ABU2MKL1_9ACTN|nr:M48 family metalloprotease [Streptomyces sp. DSM 44938]MDT0342016.1 M48 family metalloprotease [Streptomyces sp. DSM 44938]
MPDQQRDDGMPPRYPGTDVPPAYPQQPHTPAAAPPAYPGDVPAAPSAPPAPPPPSYPGERPPALSAPPPAPPVPPRPPAAPPPTRVFDPARDLALHDGRHVISGIQRGTDSTAITQLLALLPHFVCSLAIVGALTAALFGGASGTVATIAWVLSGALVFHRPTERLMARRLFRLRPPTDQEFSYLAPIWVEIAKRARVDHTVYELWIEESDEINAVAAAGHIVGLTKRSFTELPPGQLAGVLAHELGHHTGGHSWARLMGQWYALPTRVTWAVLREITRAVLLVSRKLFCMGGVFVITVIGFTVIAAVLSMPLIFVPMLLSPYVLAAVDRAAELRADRKAAELGFALTLIEVLRQSDLVEADRRGRTAEKLLSTHPSSETRIRRLQEYVRQAG